MPAGGPAGPVLRWLEREQTQNDRLFHDARVGPIDVSGPTVRAPWRPESRGRWPQQVVWLPAKQAREYGPVAEKIEAAFGVECPGGRLPLLLHPQAPRAHARLKARYGSQTLPDVLASPTSSFRSVLAWRGAREPVVLKLSLGAVVGRVRRSLPETDVVAALAIQRILETIPKRARKALGFDWFPESAGVVDAGSGTGWLLRHLPRGLSRTRGDLIPVFSLVAAGADGTSPLVRMIRDSGARPEDVVVERILRPYVRVLAYLLFEEGLHVEGHAQNVLVETDADGEMTGRLTLRDLSDVSVSVAFRAARGKAFPALADALGRRPPFSAARAVADHAAARARAPLQRGRDTVERYGLVSFLATVNGAVAMNFPDYDARAVEDAYLGMWQGEATRRLGVTPMFRAKPRGLATDEAIAMFLRHTDWLRLGAEQGVALPGSADPVLIERRARRRSAPAYARLRTGGGDLYLDGGLPAFFDAGASRSR